VISQYTSCNFISGNKFFLVDIIAKKIKVVQEVANALGLKTFWQSKNALN